MCFLRLWTRLDNSNMINHTSRITDYGLPITHYGSHIKSSMLSKLISARHGRKPLALSRLPFAIPQGKTPFIIR